MGMADHVVVGKIGRVGDKITNTQLGTITIPIRGGTEEYYAVTYGEKEIRVGEQAIIVELIPPRTVIVEPF